MTDATEQARAPRVDTLAQERNRLRAAVRTFAMAGQHKDRARVEAELRAVVNAILRRGQYARGQN